MALTVFTLLALLAVAHGAAPLFKPRIVNGKDAKLGEIPYQVSLQYKNIDFHFCGGSILNKNYVLTAAHCVDLVTPGQIKVVAGTIDLRVPGSVHNIEKIIVHENYDQFDSWVNDIALIKVSNPFVENEQVSFIPLTQPLDVVLTNDVATVSGWGRLQLGGPYPNKLQRATVYITSQSYCRDVYKTLPEQVYDTHICSNERSVGKWACSGDSGGPLVVNGKQAGIVSWSKDCGVGDYPDVYTRVSSYISWIQENAV